jgi:hypothetical protein
MHLADTKDIKKKIVRQAYHKLLKAQLPIMPKTTPPFPIPPLFTPLLLNGDHGGFFTNAIDHNRVLLLQFCGFPPHPLSTKLLHTKPNK